MEIDGGQSIGFNFDTTTFEILEPSYEIYEPKEEHHDEPTDKEVEEEIAQQFNINYDL